MLLLPLSWDMYQATTYFKKLRAQKINHKNNASLKMLFKTHHDITINIMNQIVYFYIQSRDIDFSLDNVYFLHFLSLEVVHQFRNVIKADNIFRHSFLHVLKRINFSHLFSVFDAKLERFKQIMHFLSVALFHVNFNGLMPCNRKPLIVGKVKVVNDIFIGANKAFKVRFYFIYWSAHINRETSRNLRGVVKSFDRQFALIGKENDHAFLIDLIVKCLWQFDTLYNDGFDEIVEGVNKISTKSTQFAKNCKD